jgi:putative FmdB family regulatory protein
MPTYEYACSSCGNTWEELQKITEPPVQICPACQKATAQRQISGGNFILKGGGWYADLYSSSSKPKSETKTETKTETKSDTKKDGGSSGSSGAGTSGSSSGGSSGGGSSSASSAAAE